ncbi:indole-3-acetic acid-amido synthetase GH3.17-like [Gossypium hirsutum]|uniref:Indole-3-acetic acid-amido synthetase GH3.17-like n=1 Tax=Gossypium hirsutum TaxID=3635 RepID=A0ABM3BLQ0_GOSHI|nr:indole-3-acetic acid-amido synthetase GH3.17-like [Gossypium hirsutum]
MATNGYECGLKLIKELTTNTEQIQDEVLREILSQNAGTEYLRVFLHGQTEKQLSKKNVPVVTYEDLKPYIDRIANRETSEILLAKPVTGFYLSSETSGGQPKLILVTAKYQKKGALYGTLNQSPTMSLIQRDEVVKVGSLFASVVLRGIKFLENHWQELCYDIKTGRLSDWITDSGCRDAASLVMKPNPEQADLIENICNCKSWEGIVRKLWPKARYIYCVCTGIMRQYIAELEFYCRGLPLVSTSYACSEAICGINLEPLCKPCDVSYTFLPNIDTELVDLVNVKVGQCYELVVSTCAVGDVLMVSGFYNNAPQFQFVERKNVILSVDQEKTSETDLFKAITEAKALLDPLGFILTEYTSYVDTSSAPGHYV